MVFPPEEPILNLLIAIAGGLGVVSIFAASATEKGTDPFLKI